MSKDLMIMLCGLMPEDKILDMLETSIIEYRKNPTKENKGKIIMHSAMLLTKDSVGDDVNAISDMIKETDEIKKFKEAMHPKTTS